jgi:dephospho-CoA kinase
MVTAQIEEYRQQRTRVIVLEVPLLLEAGWASLVDEVWVTIAPEATVLERLEKRCGLSKEEILNRIHSQLPQNERLRHADVVINTNCSLDELKPKIKELWDRFHF